MSAAVSQPQEGDWPPGYVPGQDSTQQTDAEGVNGTASGVSDTMSLVPLEHLLRKPQYIHCPKCKQGQKTMVKGRSKGLMTFMNIFWWPLPNRKHWFETVHWFCGNCNVEVAVKKTGKPIQVLVQE